MELIKKGPRGGKKKVEVTYYNIINFELQTDSYNRLVNDNTGYILDDNGYPINREDYVTDFPKPPVPLMTLQNN